MQKIELSCRSVKAGRKTERGVGVSVPSFQYSSLYSAVPLNRLVSSLTHILLHTMIWVKGAVLRLPPRSNLVRACVHAGARLKLATMPAQRMFRRRMPLAEGAVS